MSPLQSFYSVPVLNLKAFQQDDHKVSKPLELMDYPDTGRSGISTIRYHTQIVSINIHCTSINIHTMVVFGFIYTGTCRIL